MVPLVASWANWVILLLLLTRWVINKYRKFTGCLRKLWERTISALTALLALLLLYSIIEDHIKISVQDCYDLISQYAWAIPTTTSYNVGLGIMLVFPWLLLISLAITRFGERIPGEKSLVSEPGSSNRHNMPQDQPISDGTQVISPVINITGLETIGQAIEKMLAHITTAPIITKPQDTPNITESNIQRLNTLIEQITEAVNLLEMIPKINTLSLGLQGIVDLIQEEGALTRNTLRDITHEPKSKLSESVIAMTPTEEMELNQEWPVISNIKTTGEKNISKKTVKPTTYRTKLIEESSRGSASQANETLLEELKPRPPVILTKTDLDKLEGRPQHEVIAELTRREREHRVQFQLPSNLTAAEKEMGKESLAKLNRQWRMKAGYAIYPTDFISLGRLTDEQLTLPRNLIQQLIRNRRDENYKEHMREIGRELTRCEKCRRLYPIDATHNCFIAGGFTKETRKDGVPATRDMLVTQTGTGNILIKRQIGIDADKLNENYKKISEYKMILEDPPRAEDSMQNTPLAEQPASLSPGEASVIIEESEDVGMEAIPKINALSFKDESTGQVFRLMRC